MPLPIKSVKRKAGGACVKFLTKLDYKNSLGERVSLENPHPFFGQTTTFTLVSQEGSCKSSSSWIKTGAVLNLNETIFAAGF